MAEMVPEIKHYKKRETFMDPQCDVYLKAVIKEEHDEKLYSFVLFGLWKDGTIVTRDEIINASTANARELIELVHLQFIEILEEEFKKAEAEYFERERELNISWKKSSVYRKYYGIDIVTKEQKDVMDRVSRFLKKTKET